MPNRRNGTATIAGDRNDSAGGAGLSDWRANRTLLSQRRCGLVQGTDRGDARDAERPDERRSGVHGRCLFASASPPPHIPLGLRTRHGGSWLFCDVCFGRTNRASSSTGRAACTESSAPSSHSGSIEMAKVSMDRIRFALPPQAWGAEYGQPREPRYHCSARGGELTSKDASRRRDGRAV
jgi:hypothetical protein